MEDKRLVRNYSNLNKKQWEVAKKVKVLGRRNHIVELSASVRTKNLHIDQIRMISNNIDRFPEVNDKNIETPVKSYQEKKEDVRKDFDLNYKICLNRRIFFQEFNVRHEHVNSQFLTVFKN